MRRNVLLLTGSTVIESAFFRLSFCAAISMEMEAEISRSFLDWNCDAVCYWLSNIALSNDYSSLFKGEYTKADVVAS